MAEPLRILILEDNPADAELAQFELENAGITFTAKVVMTEEDFVCELQESPPDLILSDYDLPLYNGALALATAKRICPDIPFILVTGAVTEDRAIDILTQGAKDYVLKNRLQQRLVPAVHRALAEAEEHKARKQAEAELREANRTLDERVKIRTVELEAEVAARKEMEVELRKREKTLRGILDATKESIWLFHADGRVLLSNTTALNRFGKSEADVIEKNVRDILPPELAAKRLAHFQEVIDSGQPLEFEDERAGIKFHHNFYPVFGSQGYVTTIACYSRDITELKRAEAALQDSEKRYRRLFESAKDGVLILDADTGKVVDANPFLLQLLGYSYDELYGQHIWELGAFKDIAASKDAFKVLQNNEYIRYKDLPLETRDGQSIAVEFVSNVYLVDHSKVIQCNIRDITERKQAEDSLKESEERHRLLAETMLQGVVHQDANGTIIAMNPAAERILGKTREQFLGSSSVQEERDTIRENGELFPGTEHPSMAALRTGLPVRGVVMGVFNPKLGDYRWINIDAVPVFRSREAGPSEVYTVFEDITERKRIERELYQSEERYRALFGGMTEGFAVHEIITDEHDTPVDYRFLDINPAFERLTGLKRENVIGKTYKEVLPGDDPKWLRMYGAVALTGEPLQLENYSPVLKRYYDVLAYRPAPRQFAVIFMDITGRKLAEEALRRKEEQYRSLFENAPIGIFHSTTDGRLISANAEYARILGYGTPEEIKDVINRSNVAEVIYDKPGERAALIRQAQETANWVRAKSRYRKKDGSYVIANLAFRALPENPHLLEGFIEDITSREQAEMELRVSEEKFRVHIENSSDIIFTLNSEGIFVFISPAWERHFGYSSTDGIGEHFAPFVHPDNVEPLVKYLKRVLMTEQSETSPAFQIKHADGRWLWFIVNGAPHVNSKGEQEFIGVGHDITELKQAEAEHERLMAAIEQAGETIIITDAQGIIQFVNPAFEKSTRYSREEAVGQNARFLKSGKHDELFYRNLWDTISGGRTWTGRMDNKRKDGTLYTEEATISPVRDASGGIVNYVAVKRDITEHLRLTAQLFQSQKMESVGRLAGGVAHDFNNMLGVILGHVEMAMDQVDPGQLLHADLQEIRKAAQRSADLTRQLLAFARKQTVSPKVLDLNETMEGMLKMLRRLIGEDIHLSWLPGVNLWSIKVDPSQLDQILANLCVNARDAIAGVGTVTIETGNVSIDEDYCANHAGCVPGDYVLLFVSDDGCGMDKETLGKLFEPFFTTKETGKGTGLGLATVYGIVKQNNGFINVYSEFGQGTTFRIYLPRYIGKTEQVQASGSQEPTLRGKETILVVEDEPAILELSKRMLEKQGYRVLSAETPGEAIRLAEEHAGEIHLLMTDVVMPEMNGRDLARKLLSLFPNMKRLFMSGYTANVIAHHGVLDEGVHFIQKPFSLKGLATKVREALDS